MENTKQFTNDDLIAMIRKDCRRQAEAAETKLGEVLECLGDENHLGALGSFSGLDEDMVSLKVFLTRIARLTVGESTELDTGRGKQRPWSETEVTKEVKSRKSTKT